MPVGLGESEPYFLQATSKSDGGPPSVVLTIYSVPGTKRVQVRRTVDGEESIVQGMRDALVSELGVLEDYAAPVNRPILYTVYIDGSPVSSVTARVDSDTAWLQDPLNPVSAIPVEWKKLKPGALLLDSDAISEASYAAASTSVQVMGARYPHVYSGTRAAATGVSISMWSDDEITESGFREMVADAPVLLFRPLPEHRLLPGVCYVSGEVQEKQVTVRLGQNLTHWTVAGQLVQPVLQPVTSGYKTYDDVQDLLGGYTYASVQASASSTIYLDWQRDPTIFTRL